MNLYKEIIDEEMNNVVIEAVFGLKLLIVSNGKI